MLARFAVFLLGIGNVEQDLLDLAALVRAQLIELQRGNRRLSVRVLLGRERFDRSVQHLAGGDVDRRRRFFLFAGPAGPRLLGGDRHRDRCDGRDRDQ